MGSGGESCRLYFAVKTRCGSACRAGEIDGCTTGLSIQTEDAIALAKQVFIHDRVSKMPHYGLAPDVEQQQKS